MKEVFRGSHHLFFIKIRPKQPDFFLDKSSNLHYNYYSIEGGIFVVFEKNLTKGPELSVILKFTLPMLFGNLFQQLYNIVDSAIVGKFISSNALASVGATGSITYFFYSLCLGLGTGAGILAAQRYGANDKKQVKATIWNSAYVIGFFAIILTAVSIALSKPVLIFLNTPDEVLADAVLYMRISCAGTIAVAAYNWIAFLLRALGDSKTPLIFLIVASLLNVILDLFFILILHTGVSGAAYATILSQAISAIASITFAIRKNPYFKPQLEHIKFRRNMAVLCVKTGVPIALQNAIISVSMISLQRTANGFGPNVMAAYTASMRVEQLMQQPYSSLGSAMSTFTGQNYGANLQDRIMRCYKRCVLVVLIFSLVMMGLFLIFASPIVSIFVSEAIVIKYAAMGLRVNCCFYFFLGMIHLTRGLLNGVGDVNFALINGICEVVGRIGFAFLLVNLFHFGSISVWVTTALTWVITMILCVVRFIGWRRKIRKVPCSAK